MATRPPTTRTSTTYTDEQRKNIACDAFEPGSASRRGRAAAFEEGLITRQTMINCENGGFNLGRPLYQGPPPARCGALEHRFAESSNVAIIKVAKMKPERFEQ
jgi:cell division protein FtsI/penicillin-binding protein 2